MDTVNRVEKVSKGSPTLNVMALWGKSLVNMVRDGELFQEVTLREVGSEIKVLGTVITVTVSVYREKSLVEYDENTKLLTDRALGPTVVVGN